MSRIAAAVLALILPATPFPAAADAIAPAEESRAAAPAAAPSEAPAAAPAAEPPARPKMVSYQLVLLKRGPTWTPEVTPEILELQEAHIAHMTSEGEAGRLVVAGPFSDQEDPAIRGACVYRVGSVEEARRLASEDPAVKAGRLAVEVMTWWVEDGSMTFPKAPPMTPAAPASAEPVNVPAPANPPTPASADR